MKVRAVGAGKAKPITAGFLGEALVDRAVHGSSGERVRFRGKVARVVRVERRT